MCQVGEMCGRRNRDGVEGRLRHGLLWTPRRTLSGHQHHGRVGGCWVVGWNNAGLHMGLGQG